MGLCNLLISQWLNFPGSESQSPRSATGRIPGRAGGKGEPGALPLLLPLTCGVTQTKFLISALSESGQSLPSHREQLLLLRKEHTRCPALALPSVPKGSRAAASHSFPRTAQEDSPHRGVFVISTMSGFGADITVMQNVWEKELKSQQTGLCQKKSSCRGRAGLSITWAR